MISFTLDTFQKILTASAEHSPSTTELNRHKIVRRAAYQWLTANGVVATIGMLLSERQQRWHMPPDGVKMSKTNPDNGKVGYSYEFEIEDPDGSIAQWQERNPGKKYLQTQRLKIR